MACTVPFPMCQSYKMPRPYTPRQERNIYLFCCEDLKSSRYYLEGLGRELNINIKTCTSNNRTPARLNKRLKEEVRKKGKENVKKSYILFDRDDMSMESFKINAEKYASAVSSPCYEYWLLLHFFKTNRSFDSSQESSNFLISKIYNQTGLNLSLKQLKQQPNIFQIVDGRDGLKQAIKNAKEFNFNLGDDPYTNMHTIIEDILNKENISI